MFIAIRFIVAIRPIARHRMVDEPHMEHRPRIALTVSMCAMPKTHALWRNDPKAMLLPLRAPRYISVQRKVKFQTGVVNLT
jgi:hypothetical protein